MGTYLFKRISSDGHDSRFDKIRTSPPKFYVAWFAQATWVSLCLLPVVLTNSLPKSAFGLFSGISAKPYLSDILGLSLFVFGLMFEVAADRQKSQWSQERKEKKH